jgi:predicted metalloendopeptidase
MKLRTKSIKTYYVKPKVKNFYKKILRKSQLKKYDYFNDLIDKILNKKNNTRSINNLKLMVNAHKDCKNFKIDISKILDKLNNVKDKKELMDFIYYCQENKIDTLFKIDFCINGWNRKLIEFIYENHNYDNYMNFKDEIEIGDINKKLNKIIKKTINDKIIAMNFNEFLEKIKNKKLWIDYMQNFNKYYFFINFKFFKKLTKFIEDTDLNLLKKYLKFQISCMFKYLGTNIEYFFKNISPEVISKFYKNQYFNKEIEIYVSKIYKNIVKTIKLYVYKNFNKEIKDKIYNILDDLKLNIGCYSNNNLKFSHLNNSLDIILSVKNHHMKNELNSIGLSQDIDISFFNYGSIVPSRNYIFLGGIILNKPYLDLDETEEYNYSMIGKTIAHELTHAIDKLIFTEKDKKLLIEQFNNLGIDGKHTLIENLADIGGIEFSLNALKRIKPNCNLRKYFETHCKFWIYCDDYFEYKKNDTHSPREHRANILRNFDEFYELYDVSEKLYLQKEKRVRIFKE